MEDLLGQNKDSENRASLDRIIKVDCYTIISAEMVERGISKLKGQKAPVLMGYICFMLLGVSWLSWLCCLLPCSDMLIYQTPWLQVCDCAFGEGQAWRPF